MQDLRITLVQANQVWENKKQNLEHYSKLLDDVDTDLVLLPEMFQTGFSMNTAELGEEFTKSESIEWLLNEAKNKNFAIYTSMIIHDDGRTYNRGLFVHPDGKIDYYDKRKTFTLAKEHQYFSNGEKEVIVSFKGWQFQLQICYDLRFPEIVRNRIDSNQYPAYDVILYVANWPKKRSLHWKSLLQARAIENQCYVFGVNRVGEDKNGLEYSGNSAMIDALGIVSELEVVVEKVKTFVIKKQDLNQIREMLPFLKDQ